MNPIIAYLIAVVAEIITCSLCAVCGLLWFPELGWGFRWWFAIALFLRITLHGKSLDDRYEDLKKGKD